MLQLTNLCKTFTDKKRGIINAASDISFSVENGEVFGLLGPNGAGKTTTLRMLATVLRPTSGTATIDGADLLKQPDKVRQNIGFLSGDMGHYGRLTPRETLTFYGRLNHVPSAALTARVKQLIDRFDIGSYADTKTDKLSTGMKQKLAIARTVVHDPHTLILDEPSSGLDVPAARVVEDFILESKRAGKTIIFSSHVMEEAEYLCDRIAVVNQGKLTAIGTMSQLKVQTGRTRLREVFLDLIGVPAARGATA